MKHQNARSKCPMQMPKQQLNPKTNEKIFA